jgi:YfiH family protein
MRQRWARAVGVSPESLVRVRQLHGNAVHLATNADLARGAHPNATEAPVADAIITNTPWLALTTLHADCLAMLLVDPVNRAIAAVHAGWRSTVLDIAGETIRSMTAAFGSEPSRVLAYVGPSIGVDRYQVGDEVVDAWAQLSPSSNAVHDRPNGTYFDLKLANAELLYRAGVSASNVEISPVCTATDGDHWFSHRGQGHLTGRFAAIIAIAGDE